METELRRYERRPLNQPMVYTAVDGNGEILAQGVGRVLDFSPNGLMVETDKPIREEKLRLRITISESISISADGLLVYSIKYGPRTHRTGIKLVGSPEAVDDVIARLEALKP